MEKVYTKIMNNLLSLLIVLFVIPVVLLTILSCASKPPKVELVDGKLRPCPSSPNCVSSESESAPSQVDPLTFKGQPEQAWDELKDTLREMGGKIQEEHTGYLWATFTSNLFRFVDDVEFRMIPAEGVIHVRSGSRVGHSDLGVNRKRVEKLRVIFNRKNNQKTGQ
jgi:uncharacterized protein (DUF1499 family)